MMAKIVECGLVRTHFNWMIQKIFVFTFLLPLIYIFIHPLLGLDHLYMSRQPLSVEGLMLRDVILAGPICLDYLTTIWIPSRLDSMSITIQFRFQ